MAVQRKGRGSRAEAGCAAFSREPSEHSVPMRLRAARHGCYRYGASPRKLLRIRFLFEIPEYVAANARSCGKAFCRRPAEGAKSNRLDLGQHPIAASALNECGVAMSSSGIRVFRFMHGLVVPIQQLSRSALGCLPKGGQQRLDEYAVTFCRSFAGARWP